MQNSNKNILILMSGSIAAYKVCDLISQLKKQGYNIKVACTESALQFVGKASLEGLTGTAVQTEIFEDGQMMDHIYLNQWADVTLLAPASASIINKVAAGLCDNLVSTLILARDKDKAFLIAPAMNTKMYSHPKTQENLKTLASWGMTILPTEAGELACGDIGLGKLINNEFIINQINSSFNVIRTTESQNILITSGSTREAIDGVRHISNMSTGKTGAHLASLLQKQGHKVILLHGIGAITPHNNKINCIEYSDFESLDRLSQEILSKNSIDTVIQAAAISDFSIDKVTIDNIKHTPNTNLKISSDADISLSFRPNKKIVSQLKTYSKNKDIKIFAFKLTKTEKKSEQIAAVKKLFSSGGIDFVIHNDLLDIHQGKRYFSFYRSEQEFLLCKNTIELCDRITTEIKSIPPILKPEVQL